MRRACGHVQCLDPRGRGGSVPRPRRRSPRCRRARVRVCRRLSHLRSITCPADSVVRGNGSRCPIEQRSRKGNDQLVPGAGFEPARPKGAADFKSATSANSVIRAKRQYPICSGRQPTAATRRCEDPNPFTSSQANCTEPAGFSNPNPLSSSQKRAAYDPVPQTPSAVRKANCIEPAGFSKPEPPQQFAKRTA